MVLLTIYDSTSSVNIECHYFTRSGWGSLENAYVCDVKNKINIITWEDAIITSNNGTHHNNKSNDDVTAFTASGISSFHYFPRGLDKIFKNLIGIQMFSNNLKEIRQADLRVFPDLRNVFIYENDIGFLEEGLFKHNPKLDVIYLNYNKISEIHSDVFDHLSKLIRLELLNNVCISMRASNNATAVQIVIQQVKLKCPNPVTTTTSSLLTTTTPAAPEDIECPESCSAKISELSEEFNTFKTSSTEKIKYINEGIKNLNSSNLNALEKIETLEQKVENDVKNLNDSIQCQIKAIEHNLENSLNDIQSNFTRKINDFVTNSLPDIIQTNVDESFIKAELRIMENVENTVNELTEELKNSQNGTLIKIIERIENIEDRLDHFICETSIRLHKIETSLTRDQTKVLRIVDAKNAVMKKEIMGEIGNLEDKLDKVLKALNIED